MGTKDLKGRTELEKEETMRSNNIHPTQTTQFKTVVMFMVEKGGPTTAKS